ncbi:MAG TPA: hypothetical protein VEI95_11310 [Acidobacteriota bacterium]|nr:hypothetical protein [Acidobacteriota bacterium]
MKKGGIKMDLENLHIFPRSAFFVLFLAISLLGRSSQAWSDNYAQTRDEVTQFHDFMKKHPSVSTDLQNNPQLVNDRKYLDKHEEVKKFLKQHPAAKQEIAAHPTRVFGRYYIDDRREYSDNRPEHRWDYRYHDRSHDRDHQYDHDRWHDRDHEHDHDDHR